MLLNEDADGRPLKDILMDHVRKFEDTVCARRAQEQAKEATVTKAVDAAEANTGAGARRFDILALAQQYLDDLVVEQDATHKILRQENKNAVSLCTIHHSKVRSATPHTPPNARRRAWRMARGSRG